MRSRFVVPQPVRFFFFFDLFFEKQKKKVSEFIYIYIKFTFCFVFEFCFLFVTNIESVFVSVYQSSLNQFHIATIRFFESLFFFFSFFFFFCCCCFRCCVRFLFLYLYVPFGRRENVGNRKTKLFFFSFGILDYFFPPLFGS